MQQIKMEVIMPFDAKTSAHPNLKARVLPHNDEAEQAVLGCVMIDEKRPYNHSK